MTPKWVSFQLEEPRRVGRKTDLWHVWSLNSPPRHLGVVSWFSAWRKYAFYPSSSTIFEQDCLRDLATFIEEETTKHRKGRRAFS